MKRREFIRLGGFLTASVAAMSMTGCDIVGDNDNTSTSAEDTNSYPNPSRPMPAASTTGNWYFPQSVASGDPRDDSIILWTRVLNNSLAATAEATDDVAITLQVSSDPINGVNLGSNAALTDAAVADLLVPAYVDFDGTVRHKLSGLAADTAYYYQFTVGTVRSNIGRFKTAPVATETRDIKFAFMSCQDWASNHWGVFTKLVADDVATPGDIDFVVHLGDYIYETDNVNVAGREGLHGAQTFPNGADIPPERTTGALLPADPPGMYATTTSDYRYLYKLYRSDPRLQRMHERFPMVAVWDDHEFSDDAWQNSETYTNRNLPQTERRRNANQAWFEFMPADVHFQEVNPSFQNIKLYRDLRFGKNVHLVMTDERLYKQDHLIPEDASASEAAAAAGVQLGRINSRYLVPESSMKLAEQIKDATAPNLSLITMLGQTQRDWWKAKMSSSDATWKVWGNEVSLLRMGLNGSKAVGTLIALQTISGIRLTMVQTGGGDHTVNAVTTNYPGDSVAKDLVRAAACAGYLITNASLPAATAIQLGLGALQYWVAGGEAAAAGFLGMQLGNATLGNNAADALDNAVPSANQQALCGSAVAACTIAYMTTGTAKATASVSAVGNVVATLLNDPTLSAVDGVLTATLTGSTTISASVATVLVEVWKAARTVVLAAGTQAAVYDAAAAAFTPVTMLMAIRAEVEASTVDTSVTPPTSTSAFVTASGSVSTLAAFFRKFVINADQWDGYSRERAELMNFLVARDIRNVVAVTGDIHAFFAGTVHKEFAGQVQTVTAAGGELTSAAASSPAVMVDLVTAGVSSTSWYNYLNVAATALSASLATLVTATIPLGATPYPFALTLPVLDFALGKPFSVAALTTMLNDAIRDAAAANGVPESMLGGAAGISAAAGSIATAPGSASLRFLCYALSVMGQEVNPWLKHIDTNAQGYAVVTASATSLECQFHHVNAAFVTGGTGYEPGSPLLGGADTRSVVSRTVTATVPVVTTAGTEPTVLIS
ncbi:MAG: phosphodiesterase [Moraxellaceae bacterium]|jgi:alkaline phosphatase D|nr:phosphodiesterase [Moraxellaceae bacterium]